MDIEKLFKMVGLSYEMDKLKLESELEKTINADLCDEMKIIEIKKYISKLAKLELSMDKFNKMTNNK